MIPVDAQIWTEADVRRDGFSLETVLGEDFSDWLAPRDRSGGLVGARPVGKGQAKNGFQAPPPR